MKKTLLLKLAILMLVQWPLAAYAVPFDNLYVFGDSLSDIGNDSLITGGVVPPAEYTDGTTSGRFTNGRNYIDYLSQSLGPTVTPSVVGGTDYAYGGARTNSANLPGAESLLQQRNSYLASLGGGSADPNALYIVWAGANNLSDIIDQIYTNPSYNPTSDLATAATNLGSVVSSLAQAGAHNILVPNIPDLGIIPAVTGGGPRNAAVSGLVMGFNSALNNILNGIDLGVPRSRSDAPGHVFAG
ncbi:MAG: SGNH/GDSL hydrolase family protein [Gammaproteobacteria bacterium]